MTVLSTTFKIPANRCAIDPEGGPCTIVKGQLVARAAGLYHRLEVIRRTDGWFIAVLGMDYNDASLQFTTQLNSEENLHGWLWDFHGPEERPHWFLCTEAQLERWGVDLAGVRQDLLEVVDNVLHEVGSNASSTKDH